MCPFLRKQETGLFGGCRGVPTGQAGTQKVEAVDLA